MKSILTLDAYLQMEECSCGATLIKDNLAIIKAIKAGTIKKNISMEHHRKLISVFYQLMAIALAKYCVVEFIQLFFREKASSTHLDVVQTED